MTRDIKDYKAWADRAGIELFGPVEGGARVHPELSDEELFEISQTVINALIGGPLGKGSTYSERVVWLRETIISERLKLKAVERRHRLDQLRLQWFETWKTKAYDAICARWWERARAVRRLVAWERDNPKV